MSKIMEEFTTFEPIIPSASRDALQYYRDNKIELPNNKYFQDYFDIKEPKEEVPYIKNMVENLPLYNKTFVVKPPLKDYYSDFKDYKIVISPSARIATVHNNPGNLMFVGQRGAEKGESRGKGSWAKFSSPEEGFYALMRDIDAKANQGHTLGSMMEKYAPRHENDTTSYINSLAKSLGVSKDTKLHDIPKFQLARLIAEKESGTKLVPK